MKTINPNARPYLYAFAFLVLALIVALLMGCNPQRKIEKAKQRVELNPAAFNAIGKAWQILNPCAIDTLAVLIPGKETEIHDTTRTPGNVELIDGATDTIRIYTRTNSVDTLKVRWIDGSLVKLWRDSVFSEQMISAGLRGQLTAKDQRISEEKKWQVYAIVTWAILGLGVIAGIYLKFLKPI